MISTSKDLRHHHKPTTLQYTLKPFTPIDWQTQYLANVYSNTEQMIPQEQLPPTNCKRHQLSCPVDLIAN